jgi:hypothetical protein
MFVRQSACQLAEIFLYIFYICKGGGTDLKFLMAVKMLHHVAKKFFEGLDQACIILGLGSGVDLANSLI